MCPLKSKAGDLSLSAYANITQYVMYKVDRNEKRSVFSITKIFAERKSGLHKLPMDTCAYRHALFRASVKQNYKTLTNLKQSGISKREKRCKKLNCKPEISIMWQLFWIVVGLCDLISYAFDCLLACICISLLSVIFLSIAFKGLLAVNSTMVCILNYILLYMYSDGGGVLLYLNGLE